MSSKSAALLLLAVFPRGLSLSAALFGYTTFSGFFFPRWLELRKRDARSTLAEKRRERLKKIDDGNGDDAFVIPQ
jgi:hypothetical protein